jgi:serine/threonine protein phosphatase 1
MPFGQSLVFERCCYDMISRLFARSRKPRAPSGTTPAGLRIYAIGDIHGRLDLLDRLLAAIEADDANRPRADTQTIFLGDLIDRGPSSAQVVERTLALSKSGGNCRFLLGNHEEVFLKAMRGDQKALAFFTRIGGRETITSYGVSEEEYRTSDYPELMAMLRERVPAEHLSFLESFEDLITIGDYAFVHAGIRPTELLAHQRPSDLRWIREEFLSHDGALEKVIVHGHTITEEVEMREYRIGLDTGAYKSGRLTAMGFEGNERWIIATAE